MLFVPKLHFNYLTLCYPFISFIRVIWAQEEEKKMLVMFLTYVTQMNKSKKLFKNYFGNSQSWWLYFLTGGKIRSRKTSPSQFDFRHSCFCIPGVRVTAGWVEAPVAEGITAVGFLLATSPYTDIFVTLIVTFPHSLKSKLGQNEYYYRCGSRGFDTALVWDLWRHT